MELASVGLVFKAVSGTAQQIGPANAGRAPPVHSSAISPAWLASAFGVMTALTPNEALKWLDGTLAEFPERLDYEDVCRSMLWMTTNIVRDEREAFVGALRLLLQRPIVPWLALDLAVHHHLTELRPDLEAVADAMEQGERYPAYYGEFVPPFRKRLERL